MQIVLGWILKIIAVEMSVSYLIDLDGIFPSGVQSTKNIHSLNVSFKKSGYSR